jgi:hypothetical protein
MAAFLGKPKWRLVAAIHKPGIGCHSNSTEYRQAPCPILKMTINGVSRIIGL